MRWKSIVLVIASGVIGAALMGLPSTAPAAQILALAGLGVIAGAWLLATRNSGGVHTAGQRHNEQMLREIEKRLEHFETPDLLTQAAAIHFERGKTNRAAPLLERAIEIEKGPALRARYLLGQVYLQRNEPAKAWPHFDAVYRADRNYQFGEIRLMAARTYIGLGEPEPALALLDAFLKRERGHYVALAMKADALWRLGRYDDAKQTYREFLEGVAHAPGNRRDALRGLERIARKRLGT